MVKDVNLFYLFSLASCCQDLPRSQGWVHTFNLDVCVYIYIYNLFMFGMGNVLYNLCVYVCVHVGSTIWVSSPMT